MSHLKEPVVINFLAVDLSANDYVLLYSTPYRFTFLANFYGGYGWIDNDPAYLPSANTSYYIRNETSNTAIGRMDISTAGEFTFNSTDSASVYIPAGSTISISSPATNGIGRFGVSLVGER